MTTGPKIFISHSSDTAEFEKLSEDLIRELDSLKGTWFSHTALRQPFSFEGAIQRELEFVNKFLEVFAEDKVFAAHTPAIALVAKTIWILWKDHHEKIWEILLNWSMGRAILAATCHEIIKIGLSDGYLTAEQAFEKIETLLLDANQDYTKAAMQLLSAIPKEYLIGATSKWTTSADERYLRALTVIMLQLFRVDPNQSLKVALQWARDNEDKLDELIANTFERIVIPTTQTEEFYQSLCKQIIALKSVIGKRHKRASQAIQKVLKSAKDRRSQIINKSALQGSPLKERNRKNNLREQNK